MAMIKLFPVVAITSVLKTCWSSGARIGSSFAHWSRLVEINDPRCDRLAALGRLIPDNDIVPNVLIRDRIRQRRIPGHCSLFAAGEMAENDRVGVVIKRGFDHVRLARPALPRI